ncbi:putative colanic acid biosynthesis acetyltransferase [Thiorhodococcus mannitoliphagus]|uniref:Putative colanic acid biosynthesis acetyltransferase n=1 Tax=Thiorhodococcus mannitoliphagus TaxID=329406 RepID=A0A6P1DYM7_9GAMM|nr:putative colanic acid biosynthesis acetyltransferase [Thiorhodococcus mannitoliphagus]
MHTRPKVLSLANKLGRTVWGVVWWLLYRPSPSILHGWRRILLRVFGARIGRGAHPYPSAKIWAPWNLVMGDFSCLSHHVDCYCVDRISLGRNSTVSQYSFLCTASHDYTKETMPLMTAPITVGADAWITADVFVGPGVTIGDGVVVTARSSVFDDLPSWTVVRGNPAVFVKVRRFERS